MGGKTAEQLVNAVVRLLQDPARTRVLGENDHVCVRRTYDWNVAASQLEQVYTGPAGGVPACV